MSQIDQSIKKIKEDGYCRVEDVIDSALVAELLGQVQALHFKICGQTLNNVPFLNKGHDMIYNLQNKGYLFCNTILSHPIIREVLMTFLNDKWYRQIPADRPNYILRSLLARSGGPEAMPLHIDSFIPSSGSFAWSLQVAIILQDQSIENGCTLVVPGSHVKDQYADQSDMSAAVPVPSRAGDLVFWDSRLWHAAAANKTGKSRWSIIGTFGRWWLKQNYDIPRAIPESVYSLLNADERAMMGFCSMPPLSELDRIDIKAGHDVLRPSVTDYHP